MRSRLVVLSIASFVALFPGCRCGGGPSEPTPAATSTAPRAPVRCPSPPPWAPAPPNADHLVVEVLYPSSPQAKRDGTGMRVFDDGLVETFDDRVIQIVEGKTKNDPLQPGWRWHAKVPHKDILANLQAVAAAVPEAEVTDLQGPHVVENSRPPTLITVARGATRLRSCYLGPEGNAAQQKVEDATKKVVGDVPLNTPNDPINLPPPAASSLGKP